MITFKKKKNTDVFKEVKRLNKGFGFAVGMLKGALTEGRKKLK